MKLNVIRYNVKGVVLLLGATMLIAEGCQRESLAPESDARYDGIVKFAPSVGGIVTGVKSSVTGTAPAATGTQSLTLTSEDGTYTLPMSLSVTSMEAGMATKATLINETGALKSLGDFAASIDNTFWVAAWNDATTPAQIIPDATAKAFTGGYVSTNKEYQKVMYRDGVSGTHYWMTVQPQTATVEGAPEHADDEYIWKSTEAKKTFYAYANVPEDATVALIEKAGGQKMSCTGIPTKDILMGYYSDNGGGTGTASIQFHHPLAAVKVKKGTVADGVTIKSVAIENVYGKGELMVKQEGDSFTWTRSDGTPFTDDNLVTLGITCDGDAVFVIPQTFPSKARIRVTLEQGGKTFNVYTPLTLPWSNGTVYTYTIGYNPPSEDLLPGKFSVSATEYVQFSKGNLFCTDKGSGNYEFSFEEKQYYYRCRSGLTGDKAVLGDPGATTTPQYTSGLFQWIPRTSGSAAADWGAFTSNNVDPDDTFNDVLDFGGVFPGSDWTTLTGVQWKYLLDNHTNKFVTVIGVNGLAIAPDDYEGDISSSYTTLEQWAAAEAAGIVFLPIYACYITQLGKLETSELGYWSSSPNTINMNYATALHFYGTSSFNVNERWRVYGQNVRLVQKFAHDAVKIGNLYWATENLAITGSGNKKWKGTGHVVGDYFQWGAYSGISGNAEDANGGLLIYTSFSNTNCVDGGASDAFMFKSPETGKKYRFFTSDSSTDIGISPYYNKTGSAYTKYTSSDSKTVLERTPVNDDVVSIILGDSWRMPTLTDFQSMIDATYWAWDSADLGYYVFAPYGTHTAGTRDNAIPGDLSKSNALLFFPAAGYGDDKNLYNAGLRGRYWSSTLDSNDYSKARFVDFQQSSVSITVYPRYNGMSIRPVHD